MTQPHQTNPRIGIFGGTFDPIHNGHLACARAVLAHCRLDSIRLMPCHLPPHRATPGVSSEQRADMVALAIANEPQMALEPLELKLPQPSYTVNSLTYLKQQHPEATLCFVIGMDSLQYFRRWRQWQHLLQLAHLIVLRRPGYHDNTGDAPWLLQQYGGDLSHIRQKDAGVIHLMDNADFPESATFIRQHLATSPEVQSMLAPAVWQYIQSKRLYGC